MNFLRTYAWVVLLLAPPALAGSNPPPPGKLVDLGGYKLHLNCTGSGSPTVVLVPTSGGFSFDWFFVQQKVEAFTRVCSYDRGGEAWSELGPGPPTMHQEAYDLHGLLGKAGITGPVVLVGASSGGLVARVFAEEYPAAVAGMVLADATSADAEVVLNGKLLRIREASKHRLLPPTRDRAGDIDRLSPMEVNRIEAFIKGTGYKPRITAPFDRLPQQVQQFRLWALSRLPHFVANQNSYVPEELAELFAAETTKEFPLGAIPLIVLTSARAAVQSSAADAERLREVFAKLEMDWKAQQASLARLSRIGKQIVVSDGAGSLVLEQPQAVADAIQQCIGAVTSAARSQSAIPADGADGVR